MKTESEIRKILEWHVESYINWRFKNFSLSEEKQHWGSVNAICNILEIYNPTFNIEERYYSWKFIYRLRENDFEPFVLESEEEKLQAIVILKKWSLGEIPYGEVRDTLVACDLSHVGPIQDVWSSFDKDLENWKMWAWDSHVEAGMP